MDITLTLPSKSEQAVVTQAVRHDYFCFDGGSHIFQVENTLYKLYQDLLSRASDFFANMFKVPQPEGTQNSGSTDSYPIILPDIEVREFDNFLAWLIPSIPRVDRNVEYWADVLRIADLYMVERAQEEARQEIQTRVRYLKEKPALVMSLALRFDLRDWYNYAFRAFLQESMLNISRADAEKIGMGCVLAIFKTHALIQEYRQSFAFIPPKVHHAPHCRDRQGCAAALDDGWWKQVGRDLLNPRYPISCTDVLEKLDSYWFIGMGPECWNLTRLEMNLDSFQGEETIIKTTLDRLLTNL
ncbi:hypothetical protein BDQ17DRAFT_1309371 [Cyathus striatus]|nr:hypothetical protein BDQ17DRAFT_1309371 [Cyathus striatus]